MKPTRTATAATTPSLGWLAEVTDVIPAGCSTLAKTPQRLMPGRGAIAAVRAKDAEFTDLDGRTWLDCEMAMGTATWGHARAEVEEAVVAQLRRGTSFSVADPLELELAQRLLARFGVYESVKFAKSGADAVSGAVRIARAATGRDLVVATEYHGWRDWAALAHYSAHHTGATSTVPLSRPKSSTAVSPEPTTRGVRLRAQLPSRGNSLPRCEKRALGPFSTKEPRAYAKVANVRER